MREELFLEGENEPLGQMLLMCQDKNGEVATRFSIMLDTDFDNGGLEIGPGWSL